MELEERSIEQLPDRCQNCGARLTDAEKEAALEGAAGGPVLCTTCASEQVPVAEDEAGDAGADY
jgi:hypothetical protein